MTLSIVAHVAIPTTPAGRPGGARSRSAGSTCTELAGTCAAAPAAMRSVRSPAAARGAVQMMQIWSPTRPGAAR
jgi:hypothetical protein